MANPPQQNSESEVWPQVSDIADLNEESIKTLVRAINLAPADEFTLILVSCNPTRFCRQIARRVEKLSTVPIRQLCLPTSATTLYSTIQTELGDEMPQALMVMGLESVEHLDQLLSATNHVREEFRKNFPFPLVLWINDEVLQKLIRQIPDFKNWASKAIRFTVPMLPLDSKKEVEMTQQKEGLD